MAIQIDASTICYFGGKFRGYTNDRSFSAPMTRGEVVSAIGADAADALVAKFEADKAASVARQATKTPARAYANRCGNARGFDGRGGRVNDGAEWNWR